MHNFPVILTFLLLISAKLPLSTVQVKMQLVSNKWQSLQEKKLLKSANEAENDR